MDPPGTDGRICGHYFQTWCQLIRTSVRPWNNITLTAKTRHTTTLNRAWWVTKFARLVIFDPRGRPHHFFFTFFAHAVRPSVRPSQNFKIKRKIIAGRDCGSGRVDHWWLLSCIFFRWEKETCVQCLCNHLVVPWVPTPPCPPPTARPTSYKTICPWRYQLRTLPRPLPEETTTRFIHLQGARQSADIPIEKARIVWNKTGVIKDPPRPGPQSILWRSPLRPGNFFVLLDFESVDTRMYVQTEGRTHDVCEKSDHYLRECGLATWINKLNYVIVRCRLFWNFCKHVKKQKLSWNPPF